MEHIQIDLFSGCVYLINNRVIIQYGVGSKDALYLDITFPVSFTTTNYSMACLDHNGSQTTQIGYDLTMAVATSVKTKAKTRIIANGSLGAFCCLTIGY